MTAVNLKGTRKSFGATEVIRDVDLDIREGEFCVLLGPSGCGKSTLLRLIAGLEELSSGRIHIAGRDVTELPPKDRDVAMVFQSYALYPHMSVYDNMAFGLKLGRVSRAEIRSRVDAAARSLHIEQLLDRKPAELSGGQRQRVAIGRAIVREPRVFLFDEPLSNLDADLRVRMRLEFSELHRRLGATMIYVTHDQVEAMTLADRLVVINQGQVVQGGPPLELYRRPRNLFVAGFLGSPRINLLPGRIEDIKPDGVRVAIADGQHIQIAAGSNGAAAGADITVGIRPEHLCLDGSADNTLEGTASAVEHLGDHALVYIEWQAGRTPLVARTAADTGINPGRTVQVGFAALACHLFDAAGLAFPHGVGDTDAPRNHPHQRR